MNARFSLRPLGCPAGVDPAEWREAVATRIDELLSSAEVLIGALDVMDGDPDLEPSVIGGVEWGNEGLVAVLDDREGGDVLDEGEPNDWDAEESDPAEDGGDKEHSLGWGFGEDFSQGFGVLADCTDLEANESGAPIPA